ncbi:lysozyme [Parvularcula dongshanensis]|uniref:Lysozyme n=1 Tax=Parvularcula dongshanensis TaxID=1173995 RepID=A0A840I6B0_9PROT|nr:lysozyme [Parvularcula dongshanensis]MBB4659793.1 lysozyme [Parvularcula dongshanensis]
MKVSEDGRALIRRFEGLALRAYQDAAGVWTIGYGHTGEAARQGSSLGEADAEALLRSDLARFEEGVAERLLVPVDQNQFDALVSLAFNIGLAAFGRSTALRRLNAGDVVGAASAMTWWNKATVAGRKRTLPGLVRRRAAEAALFLSGPDYQLPVVATQSGSSCTSRSKVRKS